MEKVSRRNKKTFDKWNDRFIPMTSEQTEKSTDLTAIPHILSPKENLRQRTVPIT